MTDASRQPHLVATPADDGLVALYTQRALDRGADPRALAGASRALRWGSERSSTAAERSATARSIGRGTGDHRQALDASRRFRSGPVPVGRPSLTGSWQPAWSPKPGRRVAMAGLLPCSPCPSPRSSPEPRRLRRSATSRPATWFSQATPSAGSPPSSASPPKRSSPAAPSPTRPELTPSEILVIPTPDQTPEEAVADAAARAGTSPYVLGAHSISEGETLGEIAYWNNVDPTFLAEFNGVTNVEDLRPGQRLLIPVSFGLPGPLPEAAVGGEAPVEAEPDAWVAAPSADIAQELAWDTSDDVAPAEVVEETSEPIASTSIEGVPAYTQRYNLSCEYAAAYIATAAFGAGIDEDVFRANIGQSPNPHWGYRGWIEGAWGGTDDYGVYPEALAPTLEANGFVADVFYAGNDASALTSRLDGGMPVAVWLGYQGDTAITMEDAGTYSVAPGHARRRRLRLRRERRPRLGPRHRQLPLLHLGRLHDDVGGARRDGAGHRPGVEHRSTTGEGVAGVRLEPDPRRRSRERTPKEDAFVLQRRENRPLGHRFDHAPVIGVWSYQPESRGRVHLLPSSGSVTRATGRTARPGAE
jgi:hypothetical protein